MTAVLPCLFWIHGGGMVLGSMAMDDYTMQHVVGAVGCVVVSVEYRLAPEHPCPGPVEDCYAALKWTHAQAADLGAAPDRIAVGGPSAGGGLAAGLVLLARDRGEVPREVPVADLSNAGPSRHPIINYRRLASPVRPESVWLRGRLARPCIQRLHPQLGYH